MVRKVQTQAMWEEKQPAEAGTVGVIFDYYQRKGLKRLPDNVTVNSAGFRGAKGSEEGAK